MRHCAVGIPAGEPKGPDTPLDPTGELQAKVMRKFLKHISVRPDVILCSDLPRAEDTAKIMQRKDTPILTTPWLRPDSNPEAAWNAVAELAPKAKSILIVTHGPLIQLLLASIAFCFLDEPWRLEHGSIAYVNTNDSRFRWFVPPKLAAHVIGKDPVKVENVMEGIARDSLRLAENLMADTRAATITPLRNQMRAAVSDRWKRQLKRVKRAIRKSRGLDATSAQAMLSTVIPARDRQFAKYHRSIKTDAYSAGASHIAGQLGVEIGGAVQGIEAARKPVIPTPDQEHIDHEGYNLEDELDKTTVDRAHSALKNMGEAFTIAGALTAMQTLFDGFEDPGNGKLSRADTVALQTVSDGYHAGGKDTAAEVRDSGEQVEKRWETGGDACAICQANEEEGYLPDDQPHGSGDFEPPAHPNCDCSESYRIAELGDEE